MRIVVMMRVMMCSVRNSGQARSLNGSLGERTTDKVLRPLGQRQLQRRVGARLGHLVPRAPQDGDELLVVVVRSETFLLPLRKLKEAYRDYWIEEARKLAAEAEMIRLSNANSRLRC